MTIQHPPSGEYNALLLAKITEISNEQRDFRKRVEEKIDTHGDKLSNILVNLADGKGRMDVMQQSIENVITLTESHDKRLRSIEIGSGIRPGTVREERHKGGWISVDKLPAIIVAIGSLVAVVISSIALIKTPPSAAATVSTIPIIQPHP